MRRVTAQQLRVILPLPLTSKPMLCLAIQPTDLNADCERSECDVPWRTHLAAGQLASRGDGRSVYRRCNRGSEGDRQGYDHGKCDFPLPFSGGRRIRLRVSHLG